VDRCIEELIPQVGSWCAWARKAGVTPTLVVAIKNGRRTLTPDVRARLATAAGVSTFAVEAVFDYARSLR
jgi:plasmid maintenance system antidote protein VapI